MEYRWLKGEELRILDDVIKRRGWTPLPVDAVALCAFQDGELAAFHTIRRVPHAEPLWVRKDLRGGNLTYTMVREVASFLELTETEGYMVVADTPAAVKFCEDFGMKKVESPVYIK